MKKILFIVGTRPEAIKMAPIILAFRDSKIFETRVMVTAQHRGMMDQVLTYFDIKPDIDLNIMQPNQDLTSLTSRLLLGINEILLKENPDLVIAQGDTTTVMVSSIAAFYLKIPFGHVEAGLRTHNINSPFPEEMNRVFTGRISRFHYAPTETAKQNLEKEGVPSQHIFVTGNTVIDALHIAIKADIALPFKLDTNKRLLLVTVHRRENFGEPFKNICNAINQLLHNNPDIEILYPVHSNPNIHDVAHAYFSGNPRVILCKPLDYLHFIAAMKSAYFILTDSGGVQEEAPALGKPVLVLRDQTERPEAIVYGAVKLVGTETENIVRVSQELLDNPVVYKAMAKGVSPYGDGLASKRIVKSITEYFFQ